METFFRFLLCTLFLCVQSSQAYIVSAVLWRFNENAGVDAGTEVLVLGDLHRNETIDQEHTNILTNKTTEWTQSSEKTHFILEACPQDFSQSKLQKVSIFQYNINTKKIIMTDRLYEWDLRPLIHDIVNYANNYIWSIRDPDKSNIKFNYADCRNYLIHFKSICNVALIPRYKKHKKFNFDFHAHQTCPIHSDMDLRELIDILYTATYQVIENLRKESGAENKIENDYINELTGLSEKLFIDTMKIVTTSSGHGLRLGDSLEKFENLYYKFISFSAVAGDIGFCSAFAKHKSEYKKHVFVVGASHAAVINALMEKYQEEKKVLAITQIGSYSINDWYAKWSSYELKKGYPTTPIETQKLTSILNLAFSGIAKERICINCASQADQNQEFPICCTDHRYCSIKCKKQAWLYHMPSCSFSCHSLLQPNKLITWPWLAVLSQGKKTTSVRW